MGWPTVVRFHGFTLDAGRRVIGRDGCRVHLTRKAFDMLTTLVEEAPRVVAKEELHQRLWPGTFVTDATIASVVKELRRALGDRDRSEPLVRTVHGVGYAFTGTFRTSDTDGFTDSRYWLVSGSRMLKLAQGANDIGRDPAVAVFLDSPKASRRHARITIADNVATLEDLGSKNSTRVNNCAVTRPTQLSDGDAIQIGQVVLVFRATQVMSTTETAATQHSSE